MIKRIIILGHNGFIGRNLRAYIQKKNLKIPMYGFSAPKTDLSIPAEAETISKYFNAQSAVIMLSGIKPNISDDIDTFTKNVSMAVNISHILQKHPVARFIYMSSAAVYGEDVHNTHINESTTIQPRSYYGMAKYISECLLKKLFDNKKESRLTILRPPAIYGPGEVNFAYNPSGRLLAAQLGKSITLWGDGKEKRGFVYIDDIVELIYYFIFHSYDGVINIASSTSYSFQDIITTISKILRRKISTVSKIRTKVKVDHVFDNTSLRIKLPNFRFTSLRDGLKKITLIHKNIHEKL